MTFLNSEIQIKTREKYKLNLEILNPIKPLLEEEA